VPYLFCTGYDTLATDQRGGDRPVVHKPTNMRILIEEVRQLCCGTFPDPGQKKAA
jgi:hypothetical protein